MSNVDPEKLYRRYQTDRPATTLDDSPESSDVIGSVERSIDHTRRVDTLMESIVMRDSRESLLMQIEQDAIAPDSSSHMQKAASLSLFSTVFSSPSRFINWMKSGSSVNAGSWGGLSLRQSVPVMAVMLLAVVLTPVLFNKEPAGLEPFASASDVPVSLLNDAGTLASYIDSDTMGALGFSSSETQQGRLFDLGAAVTDMSIVAVGADREQRNAMMEVLKKYADSESSRLVKQSLDQLVAELSESEFSSRSLTRHLSDLSEGIQSSYAENQDASWFQLGQRIENVNLAADYAIDGHSVEPLADALSTVRSLDAMDPGTSQGETLNALLEELVQFGTENQLSIADARKVNSLLARIRIVVQ